MFILIPQHKFDFSFTFHQLQIASFTILITVIANGLKSYYQVQF